MSVNEQFDPVGNNHPEDIQSEFNGNKLTARCVCRSLCGPNRSDGVQHASADAIEDSRFVDYQSLWAPRSKDCQKTPTTEHPVRVLSRTLQNRTNDRPYTGDTDRRDSTVAVSKPAAQQAAEECPGQVVDGNLVKASVREIVPQVSGARLQCRLARVACRPRQYSLPHSNARNPSLRHNCGWC